MTRNSQKARASKFKKSPAKSKQCSSRRRRFFGFPFQYGLPHHSLPQISHAHSAPVDGRLQASSQATYKADGATARQHSTLAVPAAQQVSGNVKLPPQQTEEKVYFEQKELDHANKNGCLSSKSSHSDGGGLPGGVVVCQKSPPYGIGSIGSKGTISRKLKLSTNIGDQEEKKEDDRTDNGGKGTPPTATDCSAKTGPFGSNTDNSEGIISMSCELIVNSTGNKCLASEST